MVKSSLINPVFTTICSLSVANSFYTQHFPDVFCLSQQEIRYQYGEQGMVTIALASAVTTHGVGLWNNIYEWVRERTLVVMILAEVWNFLCESRWHAVLVLDYCLVASPHVAPRDSICRYLCWNCGFPDQLCWLILLRSIFEETVSDYKEKKFIHRKGEYSDLCWKIEHISKSSLTAYGKRETGHQRFILNLEKGDFAMIGCSNGAVNPIPSV